MLDNLLKNWHQLQARERIVLVVGAVFVSGVLFFVFVFQPWHAAIDHMQTALPHKRANLVWMRQTAEMVKQGGAVTASQVKGVDQSLLAVVEQTANGHNLSGSIQQMVPGENNQQVSVVLEGVSFNQWVRWVSTLQNQYGVSIKQMTADRQDDEPDIAEIRLTFTR